MTDKPDEKANKIQDKRSAEIFIEYETLLSQSQDEPSIIKALCAKYGLEKAELDELMVEARKNPPKPAPAPAQTQNQGQGTPRPDSHKP